MRHVLKDIPGTEEIGGGHAVPKDIKLELSDDQWNDIYKFTFIRNPFDWMLSTYNYILAYKVHGYHDVVSKMDLTEFIEFYVNTMMLNEGVPIGANKCVSLHEFITDNNGNVIVDFIGRFENANEDMKKVMKVLNLPEEDLPFKNVNPYREADYRVCYNDKSRALVEKYFKKDLEYFGYSF